MKRSVLLFLVAGIVLFAGTVSAEVKAALDIKPDIAIPMHYGAIVGTESDANRFADGL